MCKEIPLWAGILVAIMRSPKTNKNSQSVLTNYCYDMYVWHSNITNCYNLVHERDDSILVNVKELNSFMFSTNTNENSKCTLL